MVLQCERHEMQGHLEKNTNSHLDLSMMEISRLRRVRFKFWAAMYLTDTLY